MRYLSKILLILLITTPLWGASKISQVDFENSLSDSYSRATFGHTGGGSYVTGRTGGYAFRTTYSPSPDGYGFTIAQPSMPDSGELYISYWRRFASNFWGNGGAPCSDSANWNIKFLWLDSTVTSHFEMLWDALNTIYIYPAYGSHWSDGSTDTQYYSNSDFRGSWTHFEFYIKRSTGDGYNHDGIIRFWINSTQAFNFTSVATGPITGYVSSPAIKGLCDAATGTGTWDIDDYEAWDGMPDEEEDTTPSLHGVSLHGVDMH